MNKFYCHFYNYISQDEEIIFIEAQDEEEAENIIYLYLVGHFKREIAEHLWKDCITIFDLKDVYYINFKDVEKYKDKLK